MCLDTCHAWAAGEDLEAIVERVRAITGRVDLVHANSSPRRRGLRRATGTPASTSGTIDPELIAAVVRDAGCDAIVETPMEDIGVDVAYLQKGLRQIRRT